MNASWEQALPLIKARLETDGSPSIVLSHDDSPVMKDFADGLMICYAIDQGDRFEYLQHRDLSAKGIDLDSLHQVAMTNLRELMVGRAQVAPNEDFFAVLFDGNLEASLMLVDELWDDWVADHIPNGVVAAVAARDILAFCDAKSESGIAQLHQLVATIFPNGDHLISRSLYTRAEGRWQRYRR